MKKLHKWIENKILKWASAQCHLMGQTLNIIYTL